MSFVHGKNTRVYVDNSVGSLTDISAYCNSADFSRDVDTAETTVFSKDSKTYIPGLKDSTFSIEGPWHATIDAHMDGILGTTVSVEYGPQGDTAGNIKYSFEAICTSYTAPSSNDDAVTWSADFQVTDDVTRGTFA